MESAIRVNTLVKKTTEAVAMLHESATRNAVLRRKKTYTNTLSAPRSESASAALWSPSFMVLERGSSTAITRPAPALRRTASSVVATAVG